MVRRTVHYTGRVQGVGFRFTAQRIAARHDVTGYVRNMSDGRVEIVVEGQSTEVERFLAAVAEAMSGYIQDVQSESAPAQGQFATFEIRLQG